MKGRGYLLAWLAVAAWAGAIFAVSAMTADDLPSAPGWLSYVAHFSEYAILGGLLLTALAWSRPAFKWVALAVLLAALYGASDELHQRFVAGRQSDPLDWLTDSVGASFGAVAAWWFWRWRRHKNEAGDTLADPASARVIP